MTVNWSPTPVAAGYSRRTNTRLGAGLRLWNTLPAELRQPDVEIVTFQRLLKTHGRIVTFVLIAPYKYSAAAAAAATTTTVPSY